jgi:hypothetical protein
MAIRRFRPKVFCLRSDFDGFHLGAGITAWRGLSGERSKTAAGERREPFLIVAATSC